MPPLEDDEKVKLEPGKNCCWKSKIRFLKKITWKGLRILTSNKILTRVPILLAQIKAGNNSCKLKNDVRHILFFCIDITKSPQKFIII